jgi:LexA-binding, inner membrane-associated putative hydrolase
MNPITHFLIGWGVATSCELDRRERALITVAAIIPDFDGLGIVAEKITLDWDKPLLWWTEYHHLLGHNLTFALVYSLAAFMLAKRKMKTALLVFLSLHLHLLGDIVGARGPEGEQWPIPYFYPFEDSLQLVWEHQWALNAWPNFVITILGLAWMFRIAAKAGFSPLEFFSQKADAAFVNTVRQRLKT